MLNELHLDIIKSTVPLLETGGEALTMHFYEMLLSEHPELRPLFNQANQHGGTQQRTLANAVLMYARNIDRLEALGPLATQIINKHVSLQVLPEHYPIVGACLLRSIRDVLGAEIATDAVIEAWAAAYGQLADLLMGAEEGTYAANEASLGGWRGARTFIVSRKVKESEEIMSFHLTPADGGAVLAHKAGQYIGVKLVLDGQEIRRNYSLSAVTNGRDYRISVKREPNGVASGHLHDTVAVGSPVELFPPSGGFVIEAGDRPLVLISGGVGITPTLAMLQEAMTQSARQVTFIHCARNSAVHGFRPEIEAVLAAHPSRIQRFYCHEQDAGPLAEPADQTGRLNQECLEKWLPANPSDVDFYFLGPVGFMRGVRQMLKNLNVPDAQARYEFFGPAIALD